MHVLDYRVVNELNNFVYPQVEHLGPEYDWNAPTSILNIKKGEPLNFCPNLAQLHLDPKTRITDFITQSLSYAPYLLISPRFLKALQGLDVQPHQVFPANVILNDTEYRYHWIHFTCEVEDDINFGMSRFWSTHSGAQPHLCSFESRVELEDTCRGLANSKQGEISPAEIVVKCSISLMDLFYLQLTKRSLFISERLNSRIQDLGLNGFKVRDSDSKFIFERKS
jgi:hypothetical protein